MSSGRPAARVSFDFLYTRPGTELRVASDRETLEFISNAWPVDPVGVLAHRGGEIWVQALDGGEQRRAKLNGFPLTSRPRQLCTGDVFQVDSEFFRVDIEGTRAVRSLVQDAGPLAEDFALGLLRATRDPRGGLHLELRCNQRDPETVDKLSRSVLALETASLELVTCGEWLPSDFSRAFDQLSGLREKTTFVTPRPETVLGMRARVPSSVRVRLDGVHVPLHETAYLSSVAGSLVVSRKWAPVPRLFRRGPMVELDCQLGAQGLTRVTRRGQELGLVPDRHTSVVLLAGDEWVLSTERGQHVLSVERGEDVPGALERPAVEGFDFAGRHFTTFVRQGAAGLEPFVQGPDGIFRGSGGLEFAVQPDGQLRPPGGAGKPFELFHIDPSGALFLPAPSPFLEGQIPLPPSAETWNGLRAFAAQLLERGDGAALAFQRYVEASGTERAEWFLRLIRSGPLRSRLKRWVNEALALGMVVPREISSEPSSAEAILEAVSLKEPLFQHLALLRVSAAVADDLKASLMAVIKARVGEGLRVEGFDSLGASLTLWPRPHNEINPNWPPSN